MTRLLLSEKGGASENTERAKRRFAAYSQGSLGKKRKEPAFIKGGERDIQTVGSTQGNFAKENRGSLKLGEGKNVAARKLGSGRISLEEGKIVHGAPPGQIRERIASGRKEGTFRVRGFIYCGNVNGGEAPEKGKGRDLNKKFIRCLKGLSSKKFT